jgi:hypothetical protein
MPSLPSLRLKNTVARRKRSRRRMMRREYTEMNMQTMSWMRNSTKEKVKVKKRWEREKETMCWWRCWWAWASMPVSAN